ncbi:MAG: FHA domain-containing protein, partial [Hominimerdicola sp.]
KTKYQKFFRNMLVNTSFDIAEDNNYVAQILSYINAQNNFSLVEFNRFIQDMMSNNADNIVQETVPENVANMNSFNPLPQSVPVNSEPINNANSINIPSNSGSLPVNSGNMLPNSPNVLPTPSPETETKGKKSGFMGKLFGGEKDKKKGKKSSKKSAGNANSMTGINIPGQSPVANNIPAGEENSNNMANAAQPVAQMSNIPQMTIPASGSAQNTMYGASTANNGVVGVTMGGMPSNTNFNSGNVIPQPVVQPNDNDNESDYTTLLVDDDFRNGVAMLRRVRTNESISINKDKFVIGKEKNFVDYYVDGNAAISRSHAYILKRQESYFIVDTNSKNHTYLNGRIISSNVEEPLNNGDKIKLANEEFIFIQ